MMANPSKLNHSTGAYKMATTAFALLVRFGSSVLAGVSFRVQKIRSTGNRPTLESPAQRRHQRVLYLGTLKHEFCNLYHRVKVLRSRHLCRTVISPLSPLELVELAHPLQHKLLHARICGIRRLKTILPAGTLVDLHVVVMSIHRARQRRRD